MVELEIRRHHRREPGGIAAQKEPGKEIRVDRGKGPSELSPGGNLHRGRLRGRRRSSQRGREEDAGDESRHWGLWVVASEAHLRDPASTGFGAGRLTA